MPHYSGIIMMSSMANILPGTALLMTMPALQPLSKLNSHLSDKSSQFARRITHAEARRRGEICPATALFFLCVSASSRENLFLFRFVRLRWMRYALRQAQDRLIHPTTSKLLDYNFTFTAIMPPGYAISPGLFRAPNCHSSPLPR